MSNSLLMVLALMDLASAASAASRATDLGALHPGLARLVEVQPAAGDDIEQVVGGEDAVVGRLFVVAGDETFLLAARRGELAGLGVILAVGAELPCEDGVRRAAIAKM